MVQNRNVLSVFDAGCAHCPAGPCNVYCCELMGRPLFSDSVSRPGTRMSQESGWPLFAGVPRLPARELWSRRSVMSGERRRLIAQKMAKKNYILHR